MKNIRIQTQLLIYVSKLEQLQVSVEIDQRELLHHPEHTPMEIAKDIAALQHVIEEIIKLQEKIKVM
jgi:hypothetical protein